MQGAQTQGSLIPRGVGMEEEQQGGRHVSLWLSHVDVRQKPPQQGSRAIIFQLKIKKNFKMLMSKSASRYMQPGN